MKLRVTYSEKTSSQYSIRFCSDEPGVSVAGTAEIPFDRLSEQPEVGGFLEMSLTVVPKPKPAIAPEPNLAAEAAKVEAAKLEGEPHPSARELAKQNPEPHTTRQHR